VTGTLSCAGFEKLATVGKFGSLGNSIGELYAERDSTSEFVVLGSASYKEEIPWSAYALTVVPVAWPGHVAYRLTANCWHVLLS
jgi:hypothetical protein